MNNHIASPLRPVNRMRHSISNVGTVLMFSLIAFGCNPDKATEETKNVGEARNSIITKLMDENFLIESEELIRIETWRTTTNTPDEERLFQERITELRDYLNGRAEQFNSTQTTLSLQPFEWKGGASSHYRVFGFRVGTGSRKLLISTHIDTVSPGDSAWNPFVSRVEQREYVGKMTPFLVGRGAIDDKGPTVVAFNVLKAIAARFDGTEALKGWTVELLIDTSEETDMSTHHYLEDPLVTKPVFGIVFDAEWTVRAEKGIERPSFSIEMTGHEGDIWVESFDTSAGPRNQIPNEATLVISAKTADILERFSDTISDTYAAYTFDDPEYRKARLSVSRDANRLILTTHVAGAQHGSAPHENRKAGANPLVSLAVFASHLVETEQVAGNSITRMCQFVAWAWGTTVFGEKHPELLARQDDIFGPENGTTYAVTQFTTEEREVTLGVDIRYALEHNSAKWDGNTEGLLPGESKFSEIFPELIAQFESEYPGSSLRFASRTLATPDLRNPDSEHFRRLRSAYEEVVGTEHPFRLVAIGGGTDAKGHPELLAAGPLFTSILGPPINYHGIDEAAPIEDLKLSARILFLLLVREIASAG